MSVTIALFADRLDRIERADTASAGSWVEITTSGDSRLTIFVGSPELGLALETVLRKCVAESPWRGTAAQA